MENRTEAISARVTYAVKQELDALAKAERRSISQIIAMVIDAGLEARRKTGRKK
jgi:hypothetical protein